MGPLKMLNIQDIQTNCEYFGWAEIAKKTDSSDCKCYGCKRALLLRLKVKFGRRLPFPRKQLSIIGEFRYWKIDEVI